MSNQYQNFIKLYGASAAADAGGEFILPDNQPDVKRILHVMTNVRKTGTFSDTASLSCEGEVNFGVLYAGDDSAVHFVGYSARFTAKAPFRETDGGYTVISKLTAPETSARLANPRKLSLRCRIGAEFSVYGTENREPYIEGVEDENIEYDNVNDSSDTVSCVTESAVPVSKDLHIPPSMPEAEEITALFVVPGITSATPGSGTVTVRYDADVIAVYTDADKTPHAYSSVLHISHQTDADGTIPDSVCECDIGIYDVRYELSADQSGEMRVIELDFAYDAEIICRTPSKGSYTADMYSTEKECEAVYKDIKITHALPVYTANYTVSGEAPGTLRGSTVFAVSECENVRIVKDGGYYCEGTVGIYAVTGGGGEYENVSFSYPFRVPVTARNAAGTDSTRAVCSSGLPSLRTAGDKLHADTEIYLNVFTQTEKTAAAVSALRITDKPAQKRKSQLVLYRPGKNETRWQTAKKFKVPLSKLNEANTADSKILIIPG